MVLQFFNALILMNHVTLIGQLLLVMDSMATYFKKKQFTVLALMGVIENG